MEKLLIATNNQGKVREIRDYLLGRVEVVSLKEMGIVCEVEEDADTFLGNAVKKAVELSRMTDLPVLADDSGLCVDALGDAPGVYSARYSPEGTDEANNKKLLEALGDKPMEERGGRFECAMAVARKGQVLHTTTGACPGRILFEGRGEGGFGYDPLFLYEPENQTFSELPLEVKNQVSHRARALREMSAWLLGGKG